MALVAGGDMRRALVGRRAGERMPPALPLFVAMGHKGLGGMLVARTLALVAPAVVTGLSMCLWTVVYMCL